MPVSPKQAPSCCSRLNDPKLCTSSLDWRFHDVTRELGSSEAAALDMHNGPREAERAGEKQLEASKLQIAMEIESIRASRAGIQVSQQQVLHDSQQTSEELRRRVEQLSDQFSMAEKAVRVTREIPHPLEAAYADLRRQQESTYEELLVEQARARQEAAAGEEARVELFERRTAHYDASIDAERQVQELESLRQQLEEEREMRQETTQAEQRKAALEMTALKEELRHTTQQLEQSKTDQQHLRNSSEQRIEAGRSMKGALDMERKEAQHLRMQLQRWEPSSKVPPDDFRLLGDHSFANGFAVDESTASTVSGGSRVSGSHGGSIASGSFVAKNFLGTAPGAGPHLAARASFQRAPSTRSSVSRGSDAQMQSSQDARLSHPSGAAHVARASFAVDLLSNRGPQVVELQPASTSRDGADDEFSEEDESSNDKE